MEWCVSDHQSVPVGVGVEVLTHIRDLNQFPQLNLDQHYAWGLRTSTRTALGTCR